MIKAAIMRHGCIYISSIGTISGLIKRSTTGTFVSGNELRVLDMDLKMSYQRGHLRPLAPVVDVRPFAVVNIFGTICDHSLDWALRVVHH